MKCPFCGSEETKVVDSRTYLDGNSIKRRRECEDCQKRFTTYERIERTDLYVIKKDGRREKFDIKKLEAGIEKALEKRPIPQDKINKMISAIDEQIRKAGKKEVKSSVIGELVMKKLKKLDDVAYVRFASVYRQFQDINDFKQEVNEL